MLALSAKVRTRKNQTSYTFTNLSTEQGTAGSNCSTGSVRLADQQLVRESVAEGRVEVCVNQAWGTVCGTRFDQEDAGTACVSAGGYLRNGNNYVSAGTK